VCAALVTTAHAEKIPFRRAMELAVSNSAGMGMARADQLKARQGYMEARNAYVPQLIFGSGVAKTYGFPMSIEGSAPSVFNVNSQSFLYNPAQRQFLRAARTDINAAALSAEDQRAATILEAALTYIQLDQTTAKLNSLLRQAEDAQHAVTVARERLQEGIDSQVDVTRANLMAARVRVAVTQAQGDFDLLRQRMAQLTGLPAESIETDATSIPARPEVSQQDNLAARAIDNSPAIKAADEKAKAQQQRASGEHKQLYPAIDLVGSYGLFTRYNNYDKYFQRFSRNNATLGVAVRLPVLNFVQRSHAEAADADALKAKKQAQAAREQVSNETLKLQRSVDQLTAAREVAQLDYQLALADAEAVQAKIQAGTATIKEQEAAQMQINDRYSILLDSGFELDRARLQLLRFTGELEKWALP
jgi:outer membrane protein TolC